MSDRLLNEQPRPRIVVDVYDPYVSEALAVLNGWPGTIRAARTEDVNWDEWDVLITDRDLMIASSGITAARLVPDRVPVFVILTAFKTAGGIVDGINGVDYLRRAWSQGAHLSQPEGLSAEVEGMIQSSLLPDLLRRELKDGFGQWGVEHVDILLEGALVTRPFIKAANDVMVAGTYTRIPTGPTNWLLPADTDFVAWLREAVALWRVELPDHFPSAPAWEHADEWATAAELEPLGAIAEAEAGLERARAEHREAVTAARARLEAAREAADIGLRRLLTDDGDSLAAATAEALTTLGFTVRDMDQVYPEGQRHEDLQVIDEDGWVAIVEVTGTHRGVQQQKWRRLITHLTAYLRRADSVREAVPWLVVNQERGQDPASRSGLWQDSFREEVAEGLGLGIESPALFVLARRVVEGTLTPQRARSVLRGRRGVFTLSDAREVR